MKPPDEHDMSAEAVIALWGDQIGDIEGVDQITFEAERGPAGGARTSVSTSVIRISGCWSVRARLSCCAFRNLKATNVNDNYDKGKSQFDFTLLPGKERTWA